MAHKTLVGGTAYGITGGKCLVGGTAYSISKGRTFIGGTGYDISFGKPLSSYAESSIVRINENGSPADYYVAKHDYESDLNGSGRTLLVKANGFGTCKWGDTTTSARWSTSYVLEYLNGTYKAVLSERIVDLIGTTRYLSKDRYNSSALERSDPIFLLSITEMGFGGTEGDELPNSYIYANNPVTQKWTRSPALGVGVYYADYTGTLRTSPASSAFTICPVFTLPSSVSVGENDLIA